MSLRRAMPTGVELARYALSSTPRVSRLIASLMALNTDDKFATHRNRQLCLKLI